MKEVSDKQLKLIVANHEQSQEKDKEILTILYQNERQTKLTFEHIHENLSVKKILTPEIAPKKKQPKFHESSSEHQSEELIEPVEPYFDFTSGFEDFPNFRSLIRYLNTEPF